MRFTRSSLRRSTDRLLIVPPSNFPSKNTKMLEPRTKGKSYPSPLGSKFLPPYEVDRLARGLVERMRFDEADCNFLGYFVISCRVVVSFCMQGPSERRVHQVRESVQRSHVEQNPQTCPLRSDQNIQFSNSARNESLAYPNNVDRLARVFHRFIVRASHP